MPKYTTIDDIYAALPTIACKRLCQSACTLIPLSSPELSRLEALGISPPAFDGDGFCDKLDEMGHCTIYRDRPLICRSFGVVPELPCPHGCVPDFTLTAKELRQIWSAYRALSKGTDHVLCQLTTEPDCWGRPTKAILKMKKQRN